MARPRAVLLAVALGAGMAVAVFWLTNAPLLAAYTGGFWAVGGGMTAHNAHSIPGLVRGDSDWGTTVRLWSGAFGGLTTLAATAMIGPQVTVTAETGLVLGLFVVGVAITMANVGIGFALSLEQS